MSRYVIKRVLQGIITLFVLATVVFILARLIGNPVDLMLAGDATVTEREALIHQLGLDQSLQVQYVKFVWDLLRLDIGNSLKFNQPVIVLFFRYFPNTVRLAAVAMVFAMFCGFTLGIAAATHRGSPIDQFARAVSVVGMSAPQFWIGLMLMLLLAVKVRFLPVAMMGGPESYILPGFSLSLFTLAGTARLVRSSVIGELDSEYVKLARLKGISTNMVVWKHCLKNAILPILTFAGMQLTFLLHGSVVIESVFAWPGVGRLIYQGILGRDYPLVQGCILIVGFIVIVINLAVDILYAYVDPRIRFLKGKQ